MFQTPLMVQCVRLKNEEEYRPLTHCAWMMGVSWSNQVLRGLDLKNYYSENKKAQICDKNGHNVIFYF